MTSTGIRALAVIVLFNCNAAQAQAYHTSQAGASQPDNWHAQVGLSLSPSIGRPIFSGAADSIVDESEYEIYARAWKSLTGLHGLRVQFKAGATTSPGYFS